MHKFNFCLVINIVSTGIQVPLFFNLISFQIIHLPITIWFMMHLSFPCLTLLVYSHRSSSKLAKTLVNHPPSTTTPSPRQLWMMTTGDVFPWLPMSTPTLSSTQWPCPTRCKETWSLEPSPSCWQLKINPAHHRINPAHNRINPAHRQQINRESVRRRRSKSYYRFISPQRTISCYYILFN